MDQAKLIKFLAQWVLNSILLVVIAQLAGGLVVLGNAVLSKGLAAIFAGFLTTAVIFLVPPAVAKSDLRVKDERLWLAFYFIGLVVGVWIIKRLAVITGLGIANILYVLAVAAVLAIADFGIDKYATTLLKKK